MDTVSRQRRYRFHWTPFLRVQTDDCQGISRELAAGRDSSSFRSRLPRPRPLSPWTKLKGAIAIFQQKRGSMVEGVYVRLGDFGVSNFRRRHPSREPTPSFLLSHALDQFP